jgi:hypothetical protein
VPVHFSAAIQDLKLRTLPTHPGAALVHHKVSQGIEALEVAPEINLILVTGEVHLQANKLRVYQVTLSISKKLRALLKYQIIACEN